MGNDPDGKARSTSGWLIRKTILLIGRRTRASRDGLTVREICNRFLTNRRNKMNAGEFSPVSFADYHAACAGSSKFGASRLVGDLDARRLRAIPPPHGQRWGPVTFANEIRRIRVVFRYAEQNQLIPSPNSLGSEFKPPPRRVLRKESTGQGTRMFEAKD